MSLLSIKKGLSSNLNEVSKTDGQILVTTDTNKMYVDNNNERLLLNPDSITNLSASGKTITYTKNDGTTGTITTQESGNADSATKLQTGRTLKVDLTSTNASTAFNGTANISDIGVSGTLPIANGGTGATTASEALANLGGLFLDPDDVSEDGVAILSNADLFNGMSYDEVKQDIGNGGTATKLETARTISLTGDVTGSTSFDGSENVSITATVANNSHDHNASNITSGTLPITRGGTGATTAAAALTNLDITATAAEINKLDGLTATTTELNYVDGVTSNIQTQLDSKAKHYSWSAIITGATWSRLCHVAPGESTIGSKFILNVGATRSGIVYNDTYLICAHHDGPPAGSIVKLSGHSYSTATDYQIRIVSNSAGSCFVEFYDNIRDITNSTTQVVRCSLIPIFTSNITMCTTFNDGTTLLSGYSVAQTMTVKNDCNIQASFAGDGSKLTGITPDGIGAAAASHFHSSYLPKTGGNITGTLGHNTNYISKPVADYASTDGGRKGAITIILPTNLYHTMCSMWIDVYDLTENKSFSVHVGGYTNGNTWNGCFAMTYGANHAVRLGHDGTNHIIYIGEVDTAWSYPQISVRDVMLGYYPIYSSWCENWNITFSTSFNNVLYANSNHCITTKNISTSADGTILYINT